MANFNPKGKIVTPDNCPELASILALNQSLIGNHNFDVTGAADEEPEELRELDITVDEEDMILFNKSPFSQTDLIQTSELQNSVLAVFKEVFADIFSVKFVYDQNRGFVFMLNFRYMTDDQFNTANEDSDDKSLVRCITSSINPDDVNNKNSVAANLMMLVQQQQISSYDATKYAKITKDAKELLTKLLWTSSNNGKKKKWVKGENYTLSTQTGTGFNGGRTFTNIVATVWLDSEKVLSIFCGSDDEAGKYSYNIIPMSNNITRTDSIIKIEKINNTRKKQISNKYGVQFTK